MRNFLASWIVWQLFVIGIASGLNYVDMEAGKFDCNAEIGYHPFLTMAASVAVPLVHFVPPMSDKYCARHGGIIGTATSTVATQ